MKKLKLLFVMLILCFVVAFSSVAIADVGDFESYDSDYSWDSDYDGGSLFSLVYLFHYSPVLIIVVIVIILIRMKNKGKNYYAPPRQTTNYNNYSNEYRRSPARSEGVAERVRLVDKQFNDEQFLSWVKNIFVKLQMAWSNRDWEEIRTIESESLFEQHSNQLKGYIERKQINKIERIAVNYAELVSFSQDNEKDILIVALNSSMLDYIIDEETGKILKGNNFSRLTNTYKLTFIRKRGILTETGTDEVKTTNCPNCGAPTKITSSGRCEYCGSVITLGSHDWVLNDMERF